MPTVKAGNRICQPITQANCSRDSRTGSRSMVDLLLPSATRRTNAPHPRAQGYSDAAAKASPPDPEQLSLAVKAQEVIPGQTESADRWLACEANKRPVPIVAMKPSGQRGIS